ncbi:MAG: FHA domain-containing protein [Verrucomicrobiota bacterium]
METTPRSMINLFLKGKMDYYFTVMTQEGGAEFFIRNQQLHLLTKNAKEYWSSLIDDETASIHVRPSTASVKIGAETLIPKKAITGEAQAQSKPEAQKVKPSEEPVSNFSNRSRTTTPVDDPTRQQAMPRTMETDSVVIIKLPPTDHDQFWVGRMSTCDMVIDDPSISRWHCQLRRDGDSILLKDNQSTNGCIVNQLPVDEARINPGDFFFLGNVFCTVQLTPTSS